MEQIMQWATARGFESFDPTSLPSLGWVVPSVICGFLFRDPTSSIGFLECVISNPKAKAADVHAGLVSISNRAYAAGVRLGLHQIRSFTNRLGVARVALRCGFSLDAHGAVCLSRRIESCN
jgi:hypothetical protein